MPVNPNLSSTDTWTADLVWDVINIVLGWALGLGSALLTQRWNERRRARAVKRAISRELRETAHRLLALVYRLEGRFGGLDRELLEWMHPQIQRYAGPNPKDGMLAGVTGLLHSSDAEILQVARQLQATTPPPFIPAEEARYTASVVGQLHDLDPEYAVRVIDVLSHLRMLNDAREDGLYYHRLTFTPGLTEENHETAIANVDRGQKQMAKRARIVIDKITALEEKFQDG